MKSFSGKAAAVNRREFLKTAAAGVAVCAMPRMVAAASGKPQPDILFIMTDQMRGDCLSVLGHPVVRTPQTDELARKGTLFRRAYSTVPSCIAARYALLTGLYPQTSGLVGYASQPIKTPTLPGQLSESGYRTVLVGRDMHQEPASGSCGYQQQILGSTYKNDGEYDTYFRATEAGKKGIVAVVKELGLDNNGWQTKPWPFAEELHPTHWIVTRSRKVLAESPTDKPLFLTTSFYAPHPPLFPPKRYYDACLKTDPPKPAEGDWVDWEESPRDWMGSRIVLKGERLRTTMAGYFGLINQIDDLIGSLIAEFKKRSEKSGRPWVIVFTSDHGEMLGDHRYFRKCEPLEGSANIPFIITGSPEMRFRSGQRNMQPVCLEDLMPTLLELAGAECPSLMDGVSLVPTLRGEKRVIREWLHFEHAPCYSPQQGFHALTDGRYKYIWRPLDGTECLFDLENDPREEHDLARVAAQRHTLEQWRARLVQRLAGRPEGFSDGKQLVAGRPYRDRHDTPQLSSGRTSGKKQESK